MSINLDEIEEQINIDDEMAEDDEDEEEFINDPLSLVSVGLEDNEEDNEEEDNNEDKEKETNHEEKCSVCDVCFPSKKDLQSHIRLLHDNECVHTCGFCGAVFSEFSDFSRHLSRIHSKSLPSPSTLTLKEDVQSCPECGLKFANKTAVNIHRLRSHFNDRLGKSPDPAPCPLCESTPEDLTAHCRREHGIEGVVCPICSKILSKTCTLNRHIEQVHLNLQIHKPANCETCGKTFSKKGHLDRHVRTIHLGLKDSSEPCPFCGKVFSTKSSLEPHIEMVHKGVRKKCPNCGKILSDLWKHMRTVHGLYRRKTKIPKEAYLSHDSMSSSLHDKTSNDSKEESKLKSISSPVKIVKIRGKNSFSSLPDLIPLSSQESKD